MMTSQQVTAQLAVQYDGTQDSLLPARKAGAQLLSSPSNVMLLLFSNGLWNDVRPGWYIIQYAPGDFGVMSDDAYRRYFSNGRPE